MAGLLSLVKLMAPTTLDKIQVVAHLAAVSQVH